MPPPPVRPVPVGFGSGENGDPRPGVGNSDAREDRTDETDETSPWGTRPSPEGKDLLVDELRRLARRHPGGVEAAPLKSAFVHELAQRRERAGLLKLTPARNTGAFERTLAALARRYPPRIERMDGGWLPTARPKGKAVKGGATASTAGLADPAGGDCCKRCGARMGWPEPVGVVHADGTAEHHACRLRAAAERAVLSPDALADEAELTIRGELLP